jgi:hypothetical protein
MYSLKLKTFMWLAQVLLTIMQTIQVIWLGGM